MLGVRGEVSLELALAFDIVLGEMLGVSLVDGDGAEGVKNEATTDVDCDGVGTAVVEETLDTGHCLIRGYRDFILIIIIFSED